MIEVLVFVILVGMFFVDARLSRMVALQRAILEELRDISKESRKAGKEEGALVGD